MKNNTYETLVTSLKEVSRYYNKYNVVGMEVVKGIAGEDVMKIKFQYKEDED